MTDRTPANGHLDWTCSAEGRSNSSDQFRFLCDEVERLIRNDAHALIGGRAHQTARLIMAQLAHVHGLSPTEGHEVEVTDV